jgi:hypothetical protein
MGVHPMKKPLTLLAFTLAAAAGCTASGDMGGGPETAEVSPIRARGEALLARELADKTAGPPQACISRFEAEKMDTPNDETLLFRVSNDLVYTNQPQGGCPATGTSRRLERRTIGTNLCRGESLQVVHNTSGAFIGNCILGDFVPYRR